MQISVKVKPSTRQNVIKKNLGGVYHISVTAPAKQGKANKAVISLLAKHFNISKAKIILTYGEKSKQKTFKILS